MEKKRNERDMKFERTEEVEEDADGSPVTHVSDDDEDED
jgi:hypothetical protein